MSAAQLNFHTLTVAEGRILGHEGMGVTDIPNFRKGDRVLVSCLGSCGTCFFCSNQMRSQCRHGGWILHNAREGEQAESVRIPYPDTSIYPLPPDADEEAAVMLRDIHMKLGDTIAIVGADRSKLAGSLPARFYSRLRFSVLVWAITALQPRSTPEQ